jgi:hypothetical protein
MVGPAILNSVERAGELIFESLEFGVFQFRANARWGYSNPEFALVLELDEYADLGIVAAGEFGCSAKRSKAGLGSAWV